MGEIRIVGPGKTRGYPYPVCKKKHIHNNFDDDISIHIKAKHKSQITQDSYSLGHCCHRFSHSLRWLRGAMMLGKLPVPVIWIIVEQGPTALVVGAGAGLLGHFSLVYHSIFVLPLSRRLHI